MTRLMSRARPASSSFVKVVTREAALRILFPAEAEDPKRSRAPRRWLARYGVGDLAPAVAEILAAEPWRGEWT